MDTQGNPGPSQGQQRARKRQRTARAADAGSAAAVAAATATPAVPLTPVTHQQQQQQQSWAAAAAAMANNAHTHAQQTVRAPVDTVQSQQQPAFASQQLDRSHQVTDQDSLMGSYNTQHPHTQYPDSHSTLAPAPQPDTSGLSSLSNLAGEQHHTQHQQQHVQHSQHPQHPHHQTQQQAQQQQRSNVASSANKADSRALFQQQYGVNSSAGDSSPATVANPTSAGPGYNNLSVWPGTPTSTSAPSQTQLGSSSQMAPPQSPAQATGGGAGLAPPVDGIFATFEELLASVQRHAKEQGYNIVKLRASNYRDSKPTRYDLVCDRGGVKYNSTAKKRNPSTRKVDCPWRAKAVCEVNLGNKWRFVVQEHRHNHEARVPTAQPGQENAPVAQSIRSLNNKVDRIPIQFDQGLSRLENVFATRMDNIEALVISRLDNIEKRLEAVENGRPQLLGGNGVPPLSTPSMPTANMGGGTLGNPSMTNGGMQQILDNRMGNMEGRLGQLESGMQLIDDDGSRGMSMMVNS
ncbi:hypothetical protein QBC43DRAFT_136147 [Cladorrhinum sp. PSN259]|nr:hypothetical protein QBC43DRAFT_136147 [Cladorrhinum sp. PSN259]